MCSASYGSCKGPFRFVYLYFYFGVCSLSFLFSSRPVPRLCSYMLVVRWVCVSSFDRKRNLFALVYMFMHVAVGITLCWFSCWIRPKVSWISFCFTQHSTTVGWNHGSKYLPFWTFLVDSVPRYILHSYLIQFLFRHVFLFSGGVLVVVIGKASEFAWFFFSL